MLKKSSRRVLGFIVAALIASVAAAQPVPAAAPTSGTLLGAVSCMFCPVVLDRLDSATETETPLFTLGQFTVNAMVADPTSHLVYGVAGSGGGKGGTPPTDQMITIDTQTGIVTPSPILTVLPTAIAFDPATHQLFGVTFTSADGRTFTSELFRVDPATGAVTPLATFPAAAFTLVVDPASNALYSSTGDRLFAFNSQTGAILQVTNLNPAVSHLVYDTAAGTLYGVSSASRFVRVNPSTGAETQIGTFNFPAGFATAETIDSGTHTVYFVETDLGLGGQFVNRIATINDQTGASTLSPQLALNLWAIAFQPSAITPESIQADVTGSLASGAIDNAGVANSLLAKLSAAADARSRGQCATAANVYGSFINDLSAQSGKHVVAATATQLTAEAQFLIANCL
jgi:hypothetical protein